MPEDPNAPAPDSPWKQTTLFSTLARRTAYSLDGIRAAWRDEEAFRSTCKLFFVFFPLALWCGHDWQERAILALPCFLSPMVELINSAIENAIDRVSLERHPLAKKAKDMGSAAQLLCQMLYLFVWANWALAMIAD